MSESLWLTSASASAVVGMGWLALSMDEHWGQVMTRPADAAHGVRQVALRVLGALALLVSLLACLKADRPSMAALVWVMLLAGCALVIAMTLARWPKALRILWPEQ